MGMAASQARYLALVARKSNCEYEGQQINQARTALSNQSANLFNQMLGLQVPIPPSTQDFTVTQYSFKDGINASTISSWEQLSTADPNYNYVVTHYYYSDRYTGSQKMLNDPQVQFNGEVVTAAAIAASRAVVADAEDELAKAQEANAIAKEDYETALKALNDKKAEASNITNHATKVENITAASFADSVYTITAGTNTTYSAYDKLDATAQAAADACVASLVSIGAMPETYLTNKSELFFTTDGNAFAYQSDLTNLVTKSGGTGFNGSLNTYDSSKVAAYDAQVASLQGMADLASASYTNTTDRLKNAEAEFENATTKYNKLNHPDYVGNCELTALASLTSDQEAEIRQIVSDMNEENITSEITKCFDADDGTYTGGIYSFQLNGITYYTTYNDLQNSYESGTGINNIDNQQKMAYYNASYVSTKIEKTEKALLETDGAGRFTSIRFEDNSMTYTLSMETVTDDVAYQDAMNQYYYENAKYDKMIQDINAKTSIIQQQDQQLELKMKQLDTEQKALSTEMEAVKKVVTDSIEASFKTFGG